MIETVYTEGRYATTLDYTQPLDAPLPPQDQQFAAERIASVKLAG
jgi:hypothetical protein